MNMNTSYIFTTLRSKVETQFKMKSERKWNQLIQRYITFDHVSSVEIMGWRCWIEMNVSECLGKQHSNSDLFVNLSSTSLHSVWIMEHLCRWRCNNNITVLSQVGVAFVVWNDNAVCNVAAQMVPSELEYLCTVRVHQLRPEFLRGHQVGPASPNVEQRQC